MNIKINVRKTQEETEDNKYEAFAYTEGYGVKAFGDTLPKAMRRLRDKLKDMNKFSGAARVALERHLGYHNISIKIDKKLWTTKDTTNSKNG